jgi:hypothetical protein
MAPAKYVATVVASISSAPGRVPETLVLKSHLRHTRYYNGLPLPHFGSHPLLSASSKAISKRYLVDYWIGGSP